MELADSKKSNKYNESDVSKYDDCLKGREKRAEYAEMCERVCEENKMIQIDRKQDRHEGIVKKDG